MRPPPGTSRVRVRLYCRLLKSLDGLNQSGRFWKWNVIRFFTKVLGFVQLNGDVNILIRHDGKSGEMSTVSICEDNFLIAFNREEFLILVKSSLSGG